MSDRVRFGVAVVALLVALVYFVAEGARNFSNYFVTVKQFQADPAKYRGQVLRVQGRLLASTVRYNPARSLLRFTIASGGSRLAVAYVGSVPNEQFRDASAIVKGKLAPNGVFQAQKLMIQCPDHYSAAPANSA
jgi:cytochrome c-type biogenesis protein CcmE